MIETQTVNNIMFPKEFMPFEPFYIREILNNMIIEKKNECEIHFPKKKKRKIPDEYEIGAHPPVDGEHRTHFCEGKNSYVS